MAVDAILRAYTGERTGNCASTREQYFRVITMRDKAWNADVSRYVGHFRTAWPDSVRSIYCTLRSCQCIEIGSDQGRTTVVHALRLTDWARSDSFIACAVFRCSLYPHGTPVRVAHAAKFRKSVCNPVGLNPNGPPGNREDKGKGDLSQV